MTKRTFCALALLWAGAAWADVKLPAFFTDHMVLQQQTAAPVWGWAAPNEAVTVSGSWGAEAQTKADAKGAWRVRIQTPKAGGPFTLTVKGKNTITLRDVLIGEVWLCSGQSNMGMTVSRSLNAKEEIAAANYPRIRLLTIARTTAGTPQSDCKVRPWAPCSPKTVPSFSAAAYFFGRKLHKELGVPVGLINSSWGGTGIEAWTPWDAQKDDPAAQHLKAAFDRRDKTFDAEKARARYEADRKAWRAWLKGGRKGRAPRRPRRPVQPRKDQNYPANLYNAMIHPLAPFAIRGAIWYQGEHNAGRGEHYRVQLERLIVSWRKLWGYDFPFYFVQLPNFRAPWKNPVEDGGWPRIRESFMKTALEVPKTGMAITIDVGEAGNIHPKNKQAVGDRLARLALHYVYGKTGFAWCGPIAKSCEFRGGQAIIKFDTGGAPLAVKGGGAIVGFALTGANGLTFRAEAKIAAPDTVVVSSPKVQRAVMVHYAWANNPVGVNLINKDGLPASPFRFGSMPKFEVFGKLLPDEAKRYQLVYAFDPLAGRLVDGRTRFAYEVDRSKEIKGPFKKVAYFLALQDAKGKVTYAFVSMDPFTQDVTKIGVPAKATGARFQCKAANAVVKSNAPGVAVGEFPEGCNIEFWDCNYGPRNAAKIPNASDKLFDFGDQMGPQKSPGYGCMQIHNWKARQCIICFNRFGSGRGNDVGIGNSPGRTRDWTFSSSGRKFARGEFKVLVLK